MDMLVLPSTHSTEAFGISQLEALICGCPVISTNLDTGVADINIDDKTGLVVPARDVNAMTHAINRLAKDSKLRKPMAPKDTRGLLAISPSATILKN